MTRNEPNDPACSPLAFLFFLVHAMRAKTGNPHWPFEPPVRITVRQDVSMRAPSPVEENLLLQQAAQRHATSHPARTPTKHPPPRE